MLKQDNKPAKWQVNMPVQFGPTVCTSYISPDGSSKPGQSRLVRQNPSQCFAMIAQQSGFIWIFYIFRHRRRKAWETYLNFFQIWPHIILCFMLYVIYISFKTINMCVCRHPHTHTQPRPKTAQSQTMNVTWLKV